MSILDIGLAARVVAGIRTHTAQSTGCREWDTAGIANALKAMTGPPGACLAAACLAAEDANLDKPSAAGFMVCYPTAQAVEPPRKSHNVPCPEHTGQIMPCPTCRESARPPKPEELAEIREAYQAKVRELREERAEIEKRKAADR